MSNVTSGGETHNGIFSKVLRVLKYIAISYVISLILIAVLSAIVCYTGVPESFSTPGVKIITFLGVFISALMCAAGASGRGWLVGGLTGIANIAILLTVGFAVSGVGTIGSAALLQLLCGFVFGAAGGILGINISKK